MSAAPARARAPARPVRTACAPRVDAGLPALAAEHAVVAHAGLHVVALEVRAHAGAQVLRGERLPDRADVVALALDGEERHAPDRAGLDLAPAHHQLALGEGAVLEHDLHRLEVELRRQVHGREVLLVEAPRRVRLGLVAAKARLVDLGEGADVAVHVHRHEGGELDEARIDAPRAAGVAQRHARDEVVLEPLDRPAGRELVDLGRVLARVDRAGHQRQADRLRRVAVLRHQRRRGERGDGGLADREQVRARPHRLQELDQLEHVLVEAEAARGERHVARVVPVGDVDVVVGEQRAHRGAQQRREVPRQRRDDEHARRRGRAFLAKAQQRAERPLEDDLLLHRVLAVRRLDAPDAERGPRVAQPGEGDELAHRGELGERIQRRVAPAGLQRVVREAAEEARRQRGVRHRHERLIEQKALPYDRSREQVAYQWHDYCVARAGSAPDRGNSPRRHQEGARRAA